MARRGRFKTRKRRNQADLAWKLIGIGFLLGVVPLFLGTSALGAALRSFAPFGWLFLAIGCGALWWQVQSNQSMPAEPGRPVSEAPPRPFRRPRDVAPPVDRTATEFDRVAAASTLRTSRPVSVPQSWGPAVFDVIEWRRFEALVEALFAQAGFETKSQSHGADEGIDIWLYSRSHPSGPVSLV